MEAKNNQNNKKKKKVSKAISTEDKTWLVQPVSFTAARHNFSVIQTRAMVNIFEHLQQGILNIVSKYSKDRNLSKEELDTQIANYVDVPPFFKKEQVKPNCIYIRMPYNKFGVLPSYYSNMIEGVKLMSSMVVELKQKGTEDEEYRRYPHLFTVIVPPTGYNELWFEIENEVSLAMIDITTLGYTKYLKETVFSSSSRYTQRIYMEICSWIDVGYTNWKTMTEFREMLKLGDTEYPRFCDFYRKVIKPAYDDLKEKALNNETNCYFELEKKWYPGRAKKGTPDEIRFKIFKSEYGIQSEEYGLFMRDKIDLITTLKDEFQLGPSNARKFCDKLTEDNLQDFKNEVVRIRSYLAGNNQIVNKAAYVTTCFTAFFEKYGKQKSKKETVSTTQQDLPFAEEEVVKEQTPASQLCEEELKKWEQFLAIIKEEVSSNLFNTWFLPMLPFKYTDDTLTVKVPSKFFCEYVEDKFIDKISSSLYKIFGEGTKLMYNIDPLVANNNRS